VKGIKTILNTIKALVNVFDRALEVGCKGTLRGMPEHTPV